MKSIIKIKSIILTLIITQFGVLTTYSQSISIPAGSKTSFPASSLARIITKIDGITLFEELQKNHTEIFIENIQITNFKVTKVSENELLWEISIPRINKVIGENKSLKFVLGNTFFETHINIYSVEPRLIDFNPEVLYKDVDDYQEVTIKVDDVSSVQSIEFTDALIDIYGSYSNSIKSTDEGFFINSVENTIKLQLRLKVDSNLKFKMKYFGSDLTTKSTIEFEPQLIRVKKYLNKRFKVSTSHDLYEDDFESDQYKPKVVFDFGDQGTIGSTYKISSLGIIIKFNGGDEFKMPNDRKLEVEIEKISGFGEHEVTITNSALASDVYKAEIMVLNKPQIDLLSVSGSTGFVIQHKEGAKHTIQLDGRNLHLMNGIKLELVNILTSDSYPIRRLLNLEKDRIYGLVSYSIATNENIPTGQYYVRLSRPVTRKETFSRTYPFRDQLIDIVYPKIILDNQINLVNLNEDAIIVSKDSLGRRFESLNSLIVKNNSPITFKFESPQNHNQFGPQFLKIVARYTQSDGTIIISKMTEEGNDYVTVFDKPKYWNLKEEFDIHRLKPNDQITVTVRHSPEVYGSTSKSPSKEYQIFPHATTFDKIGLTFSLPPYLIAFRNVRGKTVTTNTDGQVRVEFNGDEKLEFQPLAVNAGLGIKYRGKNRLYEPDRFAFGVYFMGVDFANSMSDQEQFEDLENHDFIRRGSFNTLMLGEYSFINNDNPNMRIPLYFGFAWILDPLDDGKKFVPMFGLGIDIKLFGPN